MVYLFLYQVGKHDARGRAGTLRAIFPEPDLVESAFFANMCAHQSTGAEKVLAGSQIRFGNQCAGAEKVLAGSQTRFGNQSGEDHNG